MEEQNKKILTDYELVTKSEFIPKKDVTKVIQEYRDEQHKLNEMAKKLNVNENKESKQYVDIQKKESTIKINNELKNPVISNKQQPNPESNNQTPKFFQSVDKKRILPEADNTHEDNPFYKSTTKNEIINNDETFNENSIEIQFGETSENEINTISHSPKEVIKKKILVKSNKKPVNRVKQKKSKTKLTLNSLILDEAEVSDDIEEFSSDEDGSDLDRNLDDIIDDNDDDIFNNNIHNKIDNQNDMDIEKEYQDIAREYDSKYGKDIITSENENENDSSQNYEDWEEDADEILLNNNKNKSSKTIVIDDDDDVIILKPPFKITEKNLYLIISDPKNNWPLFSVLYNLCLNSCKDNFGKKYELDANVFEAAVNYIIYIAVKILSPEYFNELEKNTIWSKKYQNFKTSREELIQVIHDYAVEVKLPFAKLLDIDAFYFNYRTFPKDPKNGNVDGVIFPSETKKDVRIFKCIFTDEELTVGKDKAYILLLRSLIRKEVSKKRKNTNKDSTSTPGSQEPTMINTEIKKGFFVKWYEPDEETKQEYLKNNLQLPRPELYVQHLISLLQLKYCFATILTTIIQWKVDQTTSQSVPSSYFLLKFLDVENNKIFQSIVNNDFYLQHIVLDWLSELGFKMK